MLKHSALALIASLYSLGVPAQVIEQAEIKEGVVRLPYLLDVWAAIFLAAFAMSLAHVLNHQRGKARNVAILVAGIALLAVSGVVVTIELIDRWDYFTSAVLGPWHYWIPNTLRIASAVTFFSGLFLIWLSRRARKDADQALGKMNSDETYGQVSRFLHWSIAIMIFALIPQGLLTAGIPFDDPARDAMYVVHKSTGTTVFILVLVRIFWHRYSSKPKVSDDLKPWESRLAHVAHVLLYGFMLAFPVSGYTITALAETHPHFYFIELPYLFGPGSLNSVMWWARLHSVILPWTLYIVLGAHILGALKHHFIDKHYAAIRRMLR